MKNYLKEINLPIKRLTATAIAPSYAHGPEDSGMDLYIDSFYNAKEGKEINKDSYTLWANKSIIARTGYAVAIPLGLEGQVRPTSGNSIKTMVRVANSPGTIDSGYRGEIGVILTNTGAESVVLKKGAKIAQLVITPVYYANTQEVDELPESVRAEDGYGSTGTLEDK